MPLFLNYQSQMQVASILLCIQQTWESFMPFSKPMNHQIKQLQLSFETAYPVCPISITIFKALIISCLGSQANSRLGSLVPDSSFQSHPPHTVRISGYVHKLYVHRKDRYLGGPPFPRGGDINSSVWHHTLPDRVLLTLLATSPRILGLLKKGTQLQFL